MPPGPNAAGVRLGRPQRWGPLARDGCWPLCCPSATPSVSRPDACGSLSLVKIWSTKQPQSVATIPSKANVCCVKFHPENGHNIAFGSADHHVHYYDLRNLRQEVACLGLCVAAPAPPSSMLTADFPFPLSPLPPVSPPYFPPSCLRFVATARPCRTCASCPATSSSPRAPTAASRSGTSMRYVVYNGDGRRCLWR